MKISVRNMAGKPVKDIELPEAVFDYPYKEHLVHEAVEAVRAAARRGTHATKNRAEVSGSGRKLWRQKGTGRARVGDIRNPKWRKGGIVHGPVPRSYEKGLTPREKRNALKSALSRKLADERIVVLDSFDLDSPKTAGVRPPARRARRRRQGAARRPARQREPGAGRAQQPVAEDGRRAGGQRLRRRRPRLGGALRAGARPTGGGAGAMRSEEIIRRPLITEKSTRQRESDNVLAFEVHRDANKIEVRRAIEQRFASTR
jgi:hypothetical protein